MSYASQCIVFLLALLGVLTKSVKTDEKGNSVHSKYGLLALTRSGKVIIIFLIISFLISLYTTHQGSKEAKEKEDKLIAELGKVQTQNVALSENVNSLTKQNLDEFEKQRNNLISILETQRQSTANTTEKIENSANVLLNDLRTTSNTLGNKLASSINDVETTIDRLNRERDLLGVEVSFTPSPKQWDNILRAYQKMKSPASPEHSFPYSASTMIAVRRNGYWDIDFSPIEAREGSVRFGPVSTDQPEGVAFGGVIKEAIINLLLTWGDGPVTEIAPRGNYPSSITVSQKTITYTFRPPQLSLNVNYLKEHPTLLLQGASYPPNEGSKGYPVDVRVRSLDHSAIFDQIINLSWTEGNDKSHAGKMMPYVSGPYHLNITFRTLSR